MQSVQEVGARRVYKIALRFPRSQHSSIPSWVSFPNVGGVSTVKGSPCGTCYAVMYGNVTINIFAVDEARIGFVVSQEAMDTLTGDQAVALGIADVSFEVTEDAACLPSSSR